jgi:hypothetical protein
MTLPLHSTNRTKQTTIILGCANSEIQIAISRDLTRLLLKTNLLWDNDFFPRWSGCSLAPSGASSGSATPRRINSSQSALASALGSLLLEILPRPRDQSVAGMLVDAEHLPASLFILFASKSLVHGPYISPALVLIFAIFLYVLDDSYYY